MTYYIKNKIGSECRLPVRVHSVLGRGGSCGNKLHKQIFKNIEIWVQCRHNYELIMALKSSNICSSLITTLIIDDDVIRMCPSDMIG